MFAFLRVACIFGIIMAGIHCLAAFVQAFVMKGADVDGLTLAVQSIGGPMLAVLSAIGLAISERIKP